MHQFFAKELGVQRCGIFCELPPLLRELGVEPEPLLSRYGFAPVDFADQEKVLPFASVVRLLDECARVTKRGDFGLLLGLRASTRHLGIFGELLRNAPTLRRAVSEFVENHHRSSRGGAPYIINRDPYLVRHKDEMLIGYRCTISGLPTLQFLLSSIAAGIALCAELTGERPSRVFLGCSANIVPAEKITAMLKPSVVIFQSHHFALAYPRAIVDRPIPGAEPLKYREVVESMHSYWNGVGPDFVEQIRRLLMPAVLAQRAHMRMLCEITKLHPRTINRRLAEHGTTLRALVNESRFEVACELLKHTELPISAVADAMGYSEPGVFVRAFRQWSGMTPETWRKLGQVRDDGTAGRSAAQGQRLK